MLYRQGHHPLRNSRDQPLALVPVTDEVADHALRAAQSRPRPAKAGPIGQLDALVDTAPGRPPGSRGSTPATARSCSARNSISRLPAAAARARPAAYSERALAGSSYSSIMPSVISTSASSSALPAPRAAIEGLIAPAAGLVSAVRIDERLRHGGGHPCPQPRRRLGGHELDGPSTGAQRLLETAGVEQVQPEALMGSGRPRRIGRWPRRSWRPPGPGQPPAGARRRRWPPQPPAAGGRPGRCR